MRIENSPNDVSSGILQMLHSECWNFKYSNKGYKWLFGHMKFGMLTHKLCIPKAHGQKLITCEKSPQKAITQYQSRNYKLETSTKQSPVKNAPNQKHNIIDGKKEVDFFMYFTNK